jgi:hypothetical protein
MTILDSGRSGTKRLTRARNGRVPENDHEADGLGSMREPRREETVIKSGRHIVP